MDLEERIAKRQGRLEDLGVIVSLILFIAILFGAAFLPGLLAQHASTVRVPAHHEVRR